MISYNVPIDAQRMTIGVQGENNVREFLFDVTEWRQLTGNIGAAEMVVQRAGDSSPYAAVISMKDENTVSWVPTETDTAKAGVGKIQLMWIASGKTVKTKIFQMKVDPSLDYAVPDDSLDPWASWMPNLLNADARITSNEAGIEDIRERQTSPYNFIGSVATLADLPSSGNNTNDTYYVIAAKYRVTWTGEAWEQSSQSEAQYTDELAALLTDQLGDRVHIAGTDAFSALSSAGVMLNGYAVRADQPSTDYLYPVTNSEATPYIRVLPGDLVLRTNSLNSNSYSIIFFDESKTKTFDVANKNDYLGIIVPDGAQYMRLSKIATDSSAKLFLVTADEAERMRATSGMLDVAKYGTLANRAIWGSTTPAGMPHSDSGFSMSNYIPVAEGGTLVTMDPIGSAQRGMAFYGSDLALIEGSFVPSNASTGANCVITVPEGAAFFRMTLRVGSNRVWYTAPGDVVSEINVQEFGVVADRRVDEISALQILLIYAGMSGANIYFPSGEYAIGKPLSVSYPNVLIRGDTGKPYAPTKIVALVYQQTVAQDGTITYPQDANGVQYLSETYPENRTALIVYRYGVTVENITFAQNAQSRATSWSDKQNLVLTGISYSNRIMDADSNIINCTFDAIHRGVYVTGKNVEIKNCQFSHCNLGVEMYWATRTAVEQRGINVIGCRFHSCGRNTYGKTAPAAYPNDPVAYDSDKVCIKFPDFIVPGSSRSFAVEDNWADYCGTFIGGVCFGASISRNLAYLCRGPFVRSAASIPQPTGSPIAIITDWSSATENKAITTANLQEVTVSDSYLSDWIEVEPGELLDIKFSFGTRAYGHGFYDADKVMIDGILAYSQGAFPVPDGAYWVRFTLKPSLLSTAEVDIYSDYIIGNTSTPSYADKPLAIRDNSIVAAVETDYSPGLNIMGSAVELTDFECIEIAGNEFSGGTDDVIALTGCNRTLIDGNKFFASPGYCVVNYTTSGGEGQDVISSIGKHYIKMTDCDSVRVYNNISVAGKRHDGTDGPYVAQAVVEDGEPVVLDASNHLEVTGAGD